MRDKNDEVPEYIKEMRSSLPTKGERKAILRETTREYYRTCLHQMVDRLIARIANEEFAFIEPRHVRVEVHVSYPNPRVKKEAIVKSFVMKFDESNEERCEMCKLRMHCDLEMIDRTNPPEGMFSVEPNRDVDTADDISREDV